MAVFPLSVTPSQLAGIIPARHLAVWKANLLVPLLIAISVLLAVPVGADPISVRAGRTVGHHPTLPPTSGVFDYQLGGSFNRVPRHRHINVVVRDDTDRPLPGAYNICYINGFQTQPDAQAFWHTHQELLLHDKSGGLVVDPNWPDEYVLDPSTKAKREGIVRIIGPIIKGCKTRGFDAVEIDNLDTFTRFTQINRDRALELARDYVRIAHASGLAIAQKNTAEIAALGKTHIGFDFAIAESCAAWDECAAYTSVYGPHVLQIEYPDTLRDANIAFTRVCNDPHRAPLTILRDRNLVPRGHREFTYARC
ncbi:endo alpha-1,4 polygalactosaminidase [Stomatohabitans albus]|uniref:endo alpha-1,4 polygalactosaminidase n=1 Tax=Stomatohabitans albus TaxID=3110766 RepID=UPI00300D7C7B